MNLRHAAALSLVGWYLMISPDGPTLNSPITWQPHAPLWQWQIVDVFDTAAECKNANDKLLQAAIRLWNTTMSKPLDELKQEKWSRDLLVTRMRLVSPPTIHVSNQNKTPAFQIQPLSPELKTVPIR
jgi:hypothetical protein